MLTPSDLRLLRVMVISAFASVAALWIILIIVLATVLLRWAF